MSVGAFVGAMRHRTLVVGLGGGASAWPPQKSRIADQAGRRTAVGESVVGAAVGACVGINVGAGVGTVASAMALETSLAAAGSALETPLKTAPQ